MSQADWEKPLSCWESLNGPPDDDHVDLDNLTPEESGEEFYNLLVHMKRQNLLSAKYACILAFWAGKRRSKVLLKSSVCAQMHKVENFQPTLTESLRQMSVTSVCIGLRPPSIIDATASGLP